MTQPENEYVRSLKEWMMRFKKINIEISNEKTVENCEGLSDCEKGKKGLVKTSGLEHGAHQCYRDMASCIVQD